MKHGATVEYQEFDGRMAVGMLKIGKFLQFISDDKAYIKLLTDEGKIKVCKAEHVRIKK
jgi:hypothetical protein